MVTVQLPEDRAKAFAFIALGVLLVEELITAAVFLWDARSASFDWCPHGPIVAALTHWGMPIAAVYLLERREWRSLGLGIPRRKRAAYGLYALLGLVAPGFLLGFDRQLMIEFVEQVVYIGLAEEFFFRGYVAGRLINWLGSGKGILGSAAIFALAHFVSRVSQGGFRYPMRLAEVCLQTLIGGLLLGYIYWRSKNIYPGAILHIAGNLYIGRVIDLLNAL